MSTSTRPAHSGSTYWRSAWSRSSRRLDYTKNISKGGTFIRTKKTLPVGTRFLFRLTVPGRASPFELNGEVVHASATGDEPGMGIRFVWGQDRERVEFESVVEALMADSLGPLVTTRLLRKG